MAKRGPKPFGFSPKDEVLKVIPNAKCQKDGEAAEFVIYNGEEMVASASTSRFAWMAAYKIRVEEVAV